MWPPWFIILLQFATFRVYVVANPFPSAAYGWCLPGIYQDPTDPDTIDYLTSVNMTVKQWELYYGTIAYGSDYGSKEENEELDAIGYMYTQKIDYDATDESIAIRQIAENNNIDFESLFLHFTSYA